MRLHRFRLGLLVAVGVFLYGCDGAGRLIGPGEWVARQSAEAATSYSLVQVASDLELPTVLARVWVQPQGGTVEAAPFRLTVPKGAVAEATLFSVVRPTTGYLEVDLVAEVVREGRLVSVGEAGFAKPIELAMHFAGTRVSSPWSLAIAYVPDAAGYATIEPLETLVDREASIAKVRLKHFSRYILVEG